MHECIADMFVSNQEKVPKNPFCASYYTVTSKTAFSAVHTFRGYGYTKRRSCSHTAIQIYFFLASSHRVFVLSATVRWPRPSLLDRLTVIERVFLIFWHSWKRLIFIPTIVSKHYIGMFCEQRIIAATRMCSKSERTYSPWSSSRCPLPVFICLYWTLPLDISPTLWSEETQMLQNVVWPQELKKDTWEPWPYLKVKVTGRMNVV